MAIRELCIQTLEKFAEEEPCQIKTPESLPSSNADVDSVYHTLRRLFAGKAGKGFGKLHMQAEHTVIGPWIKEWYEGKLPFSSLTKNALGAIKERLDPVPQITQSYLMWIHDQQGDARNLFLFMIESSVTQAITSDLTLEPIEHLDPQGMSFGIRIELGPLFDQANTENNEDAVTVYLQKSMRKLGEAACHAFGFASLVDTAKQTEAMLTGIERFTEQLDAKTAAQFKKKAVEFCQDQEKMGEAVELDELSLNIDEQQPERFSQFIRENLPETPTTMRPDSRKLKQLVRFAGRGHGVSLSFSSDVINESIIYDDSKDALIITDIPKALKAQLKRYLNQQGDEYENQESGG
ncbi:nucleoid-associated protein [Hahella ganghwensis]|uniref:nucleoid-associated protein n=1 Tax=Hahella ganghwensis TaxID=286420 RepID=UPI0003712820|nr:nucleoid-associated protein [Hahella ganghwensis]